MADADFTLKSNGFLAWLHHNGFYISSKCSLTDLRDRGRGRGISSSPIYGIVAFSTNSNEYLLTSALVSTGCFEEDEIIFKIPRNAVLNVRNAHNQSPGPSSIPASVLEDMPGWLVGAHGH
jgi:N-lysine methyltransferase SETD6